MKKIINFLLLFLSLLTGNYIENTIFYKQTINIYLSLIFFFITFLLFCYIYFKYDYNNKNNFN